MPQNDGLRRYLEAGISFSQITRSRAEELVRDLIQTGEVERTRAQEWVEDLVTTNRERSEAFLSTIRKEVQRQLAEMDLTNLDELAHRVAEILARGQAAARNAGRARQYLGQEAGGQEIRRKKGTGEEGSGQDALLRRRPSPRRPWSRGRPPRRPLPRRAPRRRNLVRRRRSGAPDATSGSSQARQ